MGALDRRCVITLLTLLSSLPTPVPEPGADFWTDCFELVMAQSADTDVTLFEGIHYAIPAGLAAEDVLVRIKSSRATGRGHRVGGGLQSPVDTTCWIANPATGSTGLDAIRIRRQGAISETVVTISIVCVVNPTSTSRFWVRQAKPINFSGGTLVYTETTAPDPITDSTRVAVFITGQETIQPTRSQAHEGKFTAAWNGSAAVLTRGVGTLLARVSWAVVEFAVDWKPVQHFEFTSTAAGMSAWSSASNNLSNQITLTGLGGTALTNLGRCLLESQWRSAVVGLEGDDSQGETLELSGLDELTVRKSLHDSTSVDKHHSAWLIEWDGPFGSTPPIAEHLAVHQVGGSPTNVEEIVTRTITAVAALSTTSIEGLSVSSLGTANRFPHGHVDVCLASLTTTEETRSAPDREERRAYTAWQWPVGLHILATDGAGLLPLTQGAGAAALVVVATDGGGLLPLAQGSGVATLVVTATDGAGLLPLTTGTGAATLAVVASDGAGAIPALDGAGVATLAIVGVDGAGLLPLVDGAGTATLALIAVDGAGLLPVLTGSGVGSLAIVATDGGGLLAVVEGSGVALVDTGIEGLVTRSCLAGSYVLRTPLAGRWLVVAPLGGSYAVRSALSGSWVVVANLPGAYDLRTGLPGRRETCG